MPDPRRFRGLAYAGGRLRLANYPDGVVIDLAGLKLAGSIPLVVDHGSGLADRLGLASPTIEGNRLLVTGTIEPGTPLADRASSLLSGGGVSLSIGATPGRVELIPKGSKVTVNGQVFDGPVAVARGAELVELSCVGIGADRQATALAARNSASDMEFFMSGEIEVAGIAENSNLQSGLNADLVAARKIAADELRRQDAIRKVCGDKHGAIAAQAIEEGWTANRAELEVLRANRPKISGIETGGYSAGNPQSVLAASAARLLGAGPAAIQAAGLPTPPARGPVNLMDLAVQSLRAEWREIPTSTEKVIRAAFTSDHFSGAIASALAVVALEAYTAAEEPVFKISHRVDVADFKPTTLARLAGNFRYQPVPPGGELKSSVLLAGEKTEIRLRTSGTFVRLDREAIINDDRQMLAGVPRELGIEAARSIGDELALRLADTSFFTAARNNYLTGASSTLSVDSLMLATSALRRMKDLSGRALNLAPRFLVVPPDLEARARSILNSAEIAAESGPTGNPAMGIAEPLVDARLGASEWYLFADPRNAACVLATLQGMASPTVEPLPDEGTTLGMGWRAYFDFALGLHEHRAVIKSRGN